MAHTRDENQSLKRLAALLGPYRLRMVLAVLLMMTLACVNMVIPLFIKLLLDDVFPNGNWKLLVLILSGILGIYVARNLLYFAGKYTAVATGEHLCFTVRNRLFEHLQKMNVQFYQRNKPGQISSRVMDDTFVIQQFIQDELPKLLQAGFMFLGLLAILYAVNWQLALAATIILPLHLATFCYFKRPIKQSSRVAQQQLSMVHGNLIEKFLGMEVVKSFSGEQREGAAFEQAIDESRQSQLRSKTFLVIQKIAADLIVGLGTIGLLGFGAYHVIIHHMETGTFVAFFSYVGMLYPTVLELMSAFAKLTKASACTDRVFEMLQQGEEEQQEEEVTRFKPIRGHLRFESVCLSYEQGPRVLENIGLDVKAGQVCAIVGPSGSGKSTLVKLVPRFLEPQEGKVLVDGMDVRRFDTQYLRSAIGIAFQESFLFNSSIMENLRYAKPDATEHEIMQTARRTGAHEFILKLPQGYRTVIGEDGISLSRGEKQRIALTRAMLKNPRILILDEATASIDPATEAHILHEVLAFMKDKTTLLITHRPDLLRHADMVVKLDNGRIVYQGSVDGLDLDFMSFEPSPAPAADPARPGRLRGADSGIWPQPKLLLLAATLGFVIAGGPWAPTAARAEEATPPAEQSAAPPATLPEGPPATPPEAPPATSPEGSPEGSPETPPAAPPEAPPEVFGKYIAQAGLNGVEAQELYEVVAGRAAAELGYRPAAAKAAAAMPGVPDGVRVLGVLERADAQSRHLVQVGYRLYKTQPPHIWLYGHSLTGAEPPRPNVDLAATETFLAEARKTRNEQIGAITVSELRHRKIELSYVEPARCLSTLRMFGYTVVEPGTEVDVTKLPTIVAMPDTTNHNLVVGTAESALFPLTTTDPIHNLLVFYHPARPEQFARVLDTVRSVIDVPARQIVIEVMVLEISETGLEQLGVEWELASPRGRLASLVLGRLPAFAVTTGEVPTINATLHDVFGDFSVQIEALIRKGEAEVLSRPSVTVLDNRMAHINVEERIPVVTSIQNPNANTVTVNFKEVKAGITLNVRPRVSADEKEISMQVAAAVTARVPNADVIVRTSNGDEAARAPTISARLVKTQARVPNNTPFIIGGLVSKDTTDDRDKIPLLGDIPIIGKLLFTSTRISKTKREVIIVVTPRILPENQVVSAALPEDKDAFDSFGDKLFRDAYRIRAEDVFDLGFLVQNRQLQKMQGLSDMVVRHNADLGRVYPFNRFRDGRMPGERILVFRQMYEVVKRLELDAGIDPDRIIFFRRDPESQSGFSTTFLRRHLQQIVDPDRRIRRRPKKDVDWSKLDDQAVAITYTYHSYDADASEIFSQPVPDVSLIPCPDRATWSKQLWEMNQPDREGRRRHTILLQTAKDLTRLYRALILKRAVALNSQRHELTLSNFQIGRLLLMPTLKEDKVYLVDEQTAMYFFVTEQYYPAVKMELARDLEAMGNALRLPEISRYLPNQGRVGAPIEWQPQ